ncbi:TRAP transporter small permease subunit [Halomonas sp. AOP5-B2-8]
MRRIIVEHIGRFSVFVGQACGVFYAVAIMLSVYEVFTRYAMGTPTVWTTEVITALCATAWLLSVGAVTQQHRHITVTVMEMLVGHRAWARMRVISIVLSLVAVLGLLWTNVNPFLHAITSIERSGSAFNPPLPTYLKVMIVVALLLYTAQLIANLLDTRDAPPDHGTCDANLPPENRN